MHELSLLENVRDIIEREAERQHFSRVSTITLAIGALSCIEVDALRFAFDVVMNDSVANEAELIIETVPAIGCCRHCGEEVAMETLHQLCPACGRHGIDILQGKGMQIKDLMVS